VTTTKTAAKTRNRALRWTGDSLTLVEESDDDSIVIAYMGAYGDVIAAIRTGMLAGREIPIAGAFACALAASALLHEITHDYYSRLLDAARAVERAAPGDAALTGAIKRVLAAGDRADGPANGTQGVVKAITEEAARIFQTLAGGPTIAGGR
jgi:hypothetical protein